MNNPLVNRLVAAMLVLGLCGVPQLLAQTASQLPDSASHTWESQRTEIAAAMPQQPQEPQPQEQTSPEEEQLTEADSQEPATEVPTAPAEPSQVDPTQGPLQPVPTQETEEQPQTEGVPEAPSAQPQTQRLEQQPPATRQPAPAGTAAAERGPVAGGAASKPAGTAIAPAKQRQVRSFLIKMGAVIAGAAALGTVFALSKSSPSTPPGSETGGTRR